MRNRRELFLGLAVLALGLVGCARNGDFVYYITQETTQAFTQTQVVKELRGETRLDMLFVVDNSDSMAVHQANLIKNADRFIEKFDLQKGIEWKMGLVSTSVREEPFLGFKKGDLLEYNTLKRVEKFRAAVKRLGTHGDATERPFASVEGALKKFPDFLRNDATLAVIIMTDAPEQSNQAGDKFVDNLMAKKATKDKVVVYGVFATTEFKCQTQEGPWQYTGSPYEAAISMTKGKVYRMCEDFGDSLADIANDLVTRVARPAILLKHRPILRTLKILHNGQELKGGPAEEGGVWMYDFDNNRIVFHNLDFAPGENESVELHYDVPLEDPPPAANAAR